MSIIGKRVGKNEDGDDQDHQMSLEEKDEMAKAAADADIAELTILEQFAADKSNFEENTKLPKWLYKYLVFRFNLLDRVGKTCIYWI